MMERLYSSLPGWDIADHLGDIFDFACDRNLTKEFKTILLIDEWGKKSS